MEHENKLSASLAVLERRWDDMAGTIRDLREQLAHARKQISDLETQSLEQQEQIDALEKEKAGVIARIEGLVARYEESGS